MDKELEFHADVTVRGKLIHLARTMIDELEKQDWEGCAVREIILEMQSVISREK